MKAWKQTYHSSKEYGNLENIEVGHIIKSSKTRHRYAPSCLKLLRQVDLLRK